MNDRQENKISMYTKVSTFLSEKAADLAGYPIIATLKTKLDGKIDEIMIAEAIAGSDNTGYAQVKGQKQADLLAKTLKVGSGTAMYYTVTVADSALREKVDYMKSELDRMRDSDQYIAAKRVHEIADPVKALLGDFGITAADVDGLALARQAYYAVIQMPKEKFAETVAAGKTVDRLLDETDVILSEELDTQMQVVSIDNIDLYNIYKSARLIDDTGSGGGGGGGGETVLQTFDGVVQMMATNTHGTLATGANKMRLTVFTNGPAEAGLGDGISFNGNTMTQGSPGTIENLITYFASAGTTIMVRNQNPALDCSYRIEILG